jgi:hypothetical protein
VTAAAGGDRMLALLRGCAWLPTGLYGWGDPQARHLDLQLEKLVHLLDWGQTDAPPHLRQAVFDFTPPFALPHASATADGSPGGTLTGRVPERCG